MVSRDFFLIHAQRICSVVPDPSWHRSFWIIWLLMITFYDQTLKPVDVHPQHSIMTLFKLIQQLVTVILVRLDLAPTHQSLYRGSGSAPTCHGSPTLPKCKKVALLWINYLQNSFFPTCVKLELGSGSGSASKWKVRSGSGSASRRCRSTSLDFTPWKIVRSGKNCQITERYYESNWRFTPCASSSKNNVSPPTNLAPNHFVLRKVFLETVYYEKNCIRSFFQEETLIIVT